MIDAETNSSDFSKGFDNGIENLDKNNYEGYLSNEVSLEWLEESKSKIKDEIVQIDYRIEKTKSERIEIINAKKTNQSIFEEHDFLISNLEDENNKLENKILKTEELKAKKNTPYPFLAGLLYLAAGLTFIAGDLIISHEIVAYALNIRNSFEAWAFAFGLAGVSVLLKPAYERLIEQPYLQNFNAATAKAHKIFQIALIVISVGTLTILGWFRYEAYKTDKLKEGINRQIKTLQLEATPLVQSSTTVENPALTLKIEEKLRAYDALNQKLVESPWALLSFVLSGVLFAIAGAICLGIAFPILDVYYSKWLQLNPTKNRANRKIRRNNKKIAVLKNPWIQTKIALDIEKEKLELMPNLETLAQNRQQRINDLENVEEKIKLSMESARVSMYSEGYENGQRYRENLSDDEIEKFRNEYLKNLKSNNVEPSKGFRKNRPHQALRKAISDSLNDN